MNNLPALLPYALCSLLFAASCSDPKEQGPKDLVTFPLRGEVVKIDREAKRLSVAHEEIPNYMDAMTMAFKIKDTTIFDMVAVGDTIAGTLAVSRVESWLEGVTVVGTGAGRTMTPDEVMFRNLYKQGEPLPDLPFRDQENRPFTFTSLKGKAVAITFIYSRCPLPDFCILMSNNFDAVQKAMKRDASVRGTWQLVTVSFDTKYDTPKVMKTYGEQYNADFSVWSFLTSDQKTMDAFATGFDLYVASGEGGLIDHNLRTVLLDKQGRLVEIIKGNTWTADEVAAKLKKLAGAS